MPVMRVYVMKIILVVSQSELNCKNILNSAYATCIGAYHLSIELCHSWRSPPKFKFSEIMLLIRADASVYQVTVLCDP